MTTITRTQEQSAHLIVETLKPELRQFLNSLMDKPEGNQDSADRHSKSSFIEAALSGPTKEAQQIIAMGVTVGLPTNWHVKLERVGVTVEEMNQHGFAQGYFKPMLSISNVIKANDVPIPGSPSGSSRKTPYDVHVIRG